MALSSCAPPTHTHIHRTASVWVQASPTCRSTDPSCSTTTTALDGARSSNCPFPSTASEVLISASSSDTAPVSLLDEACSLMMSTDFSEKTVESLTFYLNNAGTVYDHCSHFVPCSHIEVEVCPHHFWSFTPKLKPLLKQEDFWFLEPLYQELKGSSDPLLSVFP